MTYPRHVPSLWTETIDGHRAAVRDAILDACARLVTEHGLRSVTMSQIAQDAGIGRATLYKYFSDVDAMLLAWHERQISGHLEHLQQIRDAAGTAAERLRAVLEAFALMSNAHGDNDLATLLHRRDHVAQAQQRLTDFIRDLLIDGARGGELRDDVAPDELVSYCLHAVGAASGLRSKAAVRRLVAVILDGLRPPGATAQAHRDWVDGAQMKPARRLK